MHQAAIGLIRSNGLLLSSARAQMQKELGITDSHLRQYLDAFAVVSSNGRTPVGLEELGIVFKVV
jgi:hypothetical protein